MSTPVVPHHLEWNDRLQDWLDGALDSADAAALQAHMADCALCRARAKELQELDRSLASAAPRLALDDSFDARIFAQIEAFDETKRAEARRRIELELQQNLQTLARGWRRALLFTLPGVVAGVALAFGLAAWLSDASVMQALVVESTAKLGAASAAPMQLVAITVLGASLGGLVARWLASVVE
ncbi:MAG TPA: zf-HC2 domain-containing protein [Steroidobacteraceae bacterium]|nr:zf-HC2 domain-containing protein [Steroidobacteraceae bacterium]